MYDRVLVPVDGSDCSIAAAREAAVVADVCDARVRLAHVLSRSAVRGEGVDPETADEAALRELAADALDDAERSLDAAGVPTDAVVRVGDAADEIQSMLAAGDADLVAMGTHGRTGVRRFLLGSVAERVVRTAPVPVITTRARPAEDCGPYEEILLPTDGTDASLTGVESGLDVAEAFDARVHVLYVVDRRLLSSSVDVGPALADAEERLRTRGDRAVAAVADRAAERGVEATTAVVEGVPHSRIRSYVTDRGVDFVAMGTHGKTGTDRWLTGSVAEQILRTSPVPVLVGRPKANAPE
ncbi:universal stress protein [Salinirarus marinus]|uniref:universal stress protein n=1 Tax=Salinirarus marinus TaxID=3068310 RepID=UPI003C6C421E